MELIITEKNASICLNMIVKNESHIIKDTLTKLCNKIKFDYWVICDTGSTDNTPDIITDFFKERNINGELYHDEWKDFSYNRTLALQRAYKKTNLLLIFDADDEIAGDIIIPTNVLFDEYHLKFGSSHGTSYTRVLLINNYKQFEFLSVIHEFISCKEPNATSTVINGNYYVISGRTGNRNLDPNKYLKDALILEKAYAEALKTNNHLYFRYAYYCANSYKDCGRHNDAIKWYKIVLGHEHQWAQEKYTACLYIYDCYSALNDRESGFFYLVKSFKYDNERVECLYHLLVHYCCEGMHNISYNYYLNIKTFFETRYLQTDMSSKLFINIDKYNFFLPYYMIIIADKVQDFKCVIRMYEIIFIKKQKMFEEWYIRNLLYNLQFFLQHVPSNNTQFNILANDYFKFLNDNNVKLNKCDFLNKDVYKNSGFKLDYIFNTPVTDKTNKFSKEECENSKNILIYTGFSEVKWNYSYMLNNALGGSEKAVAYISQLFPKDYNIFICGDVKNETIDNITYLHLSELTNLINHTPFHTVIVSRYISFYEMFKECSFYQSFIWGHDVMLLPYGCELNSNQIIVKWNNYINGCICLTDWHKKTFIEKYPILENKIHLINNGLDVSNFKTTNNKGNIKIKNKFIYSSRPDRGLKKLLNLWSSILERIPDAILTISSYGNFPSNSEEEQMQNIINNYPTSIKHLGKLNANALYEEMSSAEYWLYPTDWPETSCITALEMLMSDVICLYYPVAGLINTMDAYGIQVSSGNEIDTIVSLTEELKCKLRVSGKKYAELCSWFNRAKIWKNLLSIGQTDILNTTNNIKETWLFVFPVWYSIKNLEDYTDSLKTIYDIICINNNTNISKITPDKVLFVYHVSDKGIYDYYFKQNIEIGLFNPEPLNLIHRLNNIKSCADLYTGIKIYDYSLSNIKILNENGYFNTEHLKYKIYDEENMFLKTLNDSTPKTYDFGIISVENPIVVKRRGEVVNFLLKHNYSVNIISGWKEFRDRELAKCSIILNIHGSNNGEESNIFEHIRCDRLLEAGFKILSEESLFLDSKFIEKYPNLTLKPYTNFFELDTYTNLKINKQNIQIIDCFTFYNEINMLIYRLNILYDIVDYFILVEANQTHVGKTKPLYFNENKHMFEKFLDKIIYINVDLPYKYDTINIEKGEQWINEKFQRNAISQGIDKIKHNLTNNDYIIISDIDEIVDPNTLIKFKNKTINNDINVLEQEFYYYNLNCKHKEKWYHAKIIKFSKYNELNTTCDNIRFLNGTTINKGGWHLSYFGDSNFIKNKLENFSHQEYNSNNFTDTDKIEYRINNCLDLFDRDKINNTKCINNIENISIYDNIYLPPQYQTYLTPFYVNPDKPKIYCFIHSCTLPTTGTNNLDFIIKVIIKTGFINIVDKIFINNIGIPIENIYENEKISITNYSENVLLFEYPTLNKIKHLAYEEPNAYILYLHTKGITHNKNMLHNINDWIYLMLYFLVEKYEECIDNLNKGYETVGCNFNKSNNEYTDHYSGNFWWSKGKYINKLKVLDETCINRSYSEFWLFTANPEYYIIYSSYPHNHYLSPYPIQTYTQNSIIEQITL
jgi:beta-1,4-mannosyl-glycoprotein beta-1,4-N-acetylglucosaminyltransferase